MYLYEIAISVVRVSLEIGSAQCAYFCVDTLLKRLKGKCSVDRIEISSSIFWLSSTRWYVSLYTKESGYMCSTWNIEIVT